MTRQVKTPKVGFMPLTATIKTWLKAVFRPSVTYYTELAESPYATTQQAILWMAIVGLISGLFQVIFSLGYEYANSGQINWTTLASLPLYPVITMVGQFLITASIHVVARLVGGHGRFEQTIFVMTACTAILSIFASGLFPVIRGTIFAVIYLYWPILYVLAIRVSHKFSISRTLIVTIVGSIIFSILLVPLLLAYVYVVSALTGPNI